MNAFCASENFDAFIVFRSSQPKESGAENSNSERSSLLGADHNVNGAVESFRCVETTLKIKTRQVARQRMERVKGIEPSYSAWKAAALPLSYTREFGGLLTGTLSLAKNDPGLCLTAVLARRLVGEVGLEPTKA